MPFTPSHVVAILPFARTPLAPAALAIGAMTPDIPYFLPVNADRNLTHSLVGAVTVDLLVGLVAFALWVLLLRAPVLDYSPAWLRERMAPTARWRVRGVVVSTLLVVAAIELGILTHLLLDLFTHEGGWLETVAPVTSTRIGPFSIANVIHAAVSIVTAALLAWWVLRWARRTPRTERPSRLRPVERPAAWGIVAAVLVAVGIVCWWGGVRVGFHPLDPDNLGASFFVAVAVAGAAALALTLLWRLRKVI